MQARRVIVFVSWVVRSTSLYSPESRRSHMTRIAAVLSPWAVCSRQYRSCYRPTTLTTWVQDRCASREDRPGFALRACGCLPPKRPLMLVAWKLARRPSGCAGFPRCRAGPPARCGARAPTTFASFSQHQRLPVRSLLPGARHTSVFRSVPQRFALARFSLVLLLTASLCLLDTVDVSQGHVLHQATEPLAAPAVMSAAIRPLICSGDTPVMHGSARRTLGR